MTREGEIAPDPEGDLPPGPPPGDDPPDADPEPPSGDVGTDPPEPPDDPDKDWKDLQAKYPDKSPEELQRFVAKAYWDQTKEIATYVKDKHAADVEKARLEGRLEGRGTPPGEEPPEDDFSDIPEIQEVDSHLNDLNQRGEQLKAEQRESLKELSKENDELGELRGELRVAERTENEEEIRRLKSDIRVQEKAVRSVRKDLDRQMREAHGLERQMARAAREKHYLVNLAKQGKANAEQEQRDIDAALEKIPQQVDDAITEAMKSAKVPASLIDDCREIAQNGTTVDLWKIGSDVPFNQVDVPRIVAKHVSQFMKANGIATKTTFAARSEEKTRLADGEPPKPSKKTTETAPRHISMISPVGELSPGMARARRILTGLDR